jgi:hypothetical protein
MTASTVALPEFTEKEANADALRQLNRPGFRGGSNSREWSHEEVPEVFTRGA